MSDDPLLKLRQELGKQARDSMLTALLNYQPMYELKVGDIHQIAGMVQSIVFDAVLKAQVDAQK